MDGTYKLSNKDVKFIVSDKRVKDITQRKDGIIEVYTNDITMYLHPMEVIQFNNDSNRARLKQANLGKVQIEIDILESFSGGQFPFRITNSYPKKYSCHHPMYHYNHTRIKTGGCLGSFGPAFRKAFTNTDIVEIVFTILASMEHVYNHESRFWSWT